MKVLTKNKQPTLSVVIPVWNREIEIAHAVRSIAQQRNGRDIEIIVVDDTSTDNTARVVRDLANEFDCVRLVRKTARGGAAAARNAGLSVAKGAFIWFVDSDDFIAEGAIELIWRELKDEWPDVLRFDKRDEQEVVPAYSIERNVNPKTEHIDLQTDANGLLTCLSMGSVWNAIFARQTIGNIVFNESFSYGEDALFTWAVVLSSRQCVYIHAPLYVYMETTGSLTSVKTAERFNCYMRQVEVFSQLVDRSPLMGSIKQRLLSECCWRIYSHAFGCYLPEEIDDGMWDVWRKAYRAVMIDNHRRRWTDRWLSRMVFPFLSKNSAYGIFKSKLERRRKGREQ